jgi:hypothetical protein
MPERRLLCDPVTQLYSPLQERVANRPDMHRIGLNWNARKGGGEVVVYVARDTVLHLPLSGKGDKQAVHVQDWVKIKMWGVYVVT